MTTDRDKSYRVLLVDDDKMHVKIFSYFLERSSCPLTRFGVASSIEEAIAAVGDMAPDIVFLDNKMPPEVDYRHNLERLRAAGFAGPVVVSSASIDEPAFAEADRRGVASVVDKSMIRSDVLRTLIERYA